MTPGNRHPSLRAVFDEPKVTWQELRWFAHRLEDAALLNDVHPKDGATLVRLVLSFNKQIVGNVRKTRPSTPPLTSVVTPRGRR